jgi:hypothetical protein
VPYLPVRLFSAQLTEIIKFYEGLTNLIVPNMKFQKGKYPGTDKWILNRVYSYYVDARKGLTKSCRDYEDEINDVEARCRTFQFAYSQHS